jgi:transposase
VRIVAETGKSVAQVARDLGISAYTLHNWVRAERQAEAGQARDGLVTESEREELAGLRAEKARWAKEKAELEMERDVLKRSVVLWVKDAMNQ